jgi:hypothetical protein
VKALFSSAPVIKRPVPAVSAVNVVNVSTTEQFAQNL